MKALALIIGNSSYSIGDLINPINDAQDFADILERLGFDTTTLVDIDQQTMNQAIEEFGEKLNDYSIGLFYFAGHGIQIKGENFLTTTSTNFESENSTKYSSVSLDKVLAYMDDALNRTNIIILDACRNNPYEKKWHRSTKINGLAPVFAPKGTIIAFATSPGEVAYNGTGRNGVYTNAMLNHIVEPNVTIEDFFKKVRNSVSAFTNGEQTTWEHTSLTGTFKFNSGQLIHSTSIPYKPESVADKNATFNENDPIDKIILELKSHNYYIQNDGISHLMRCEIDKATTDQLFLLGRNLLQSANGGAHSAYSYLKNISSRLASFNSEDGMNHFLNGILFEMYFDANGLFRKPQIKGTKFLEEIRSLEMSGLYGKSFNFIFQQLVQFQDSLFYIPGSGQNSKLNFDVILEPMEVPIIENVTRKEYFIKDVLFEDQSLLVLTSKGRNSHNAYHSSIYFSEFQEKITHNGAIPESMLTISSDPKLKDSDYCSIPFTCRIMKPGNQIEDMTGLN